MRKLNARSHWRNLDHFHGDRAKYHSVNIRHRDGAGLGKGVVLRFLDERIDAVLTTEVQLLISQPADEDGRIYGDGIASDRTEETRASID